jgi:hypothetical protein
MKISRILVSKQEQNEALQVDVFPLQAGSTRN